MLSGHVIWTCQKTELMVRVITVLQFWGRKVITLFSLSFMVFLKLGSCLVVFFLPSHKMTKAWVLLVCFGLFTDVLSGVNIPSYPAPPSLSLFLFIYWFCLLFLLRPHWPCDDCSLQTKHMVMMRKRTDKQLKCNGNFYSSIAKKECTEKKVWAPTGHQGNSKWTRNLDFLNKNKINSQPVYNFQPTDASVSRTTGAYTNLNPIAYGR